MSNKKQILKHSLLLLVWLIQTAHLYGQMKKPVLKKPLLSRLFQNKPVKKPLAKPVLPTPPGIKPPSVQPKQTPSQSTTAKKAPNVSLAPPAKPLLPQKAVPLNPKKTSPQVDQEEAASIYLNFENASLASIVNYLGEEKKINILPDKDLEATKVTLTTRNPMTLDRAWNVLLTLLEMNGFSMIQVGKIYRIVKSQENGQVPLPVYSSATGTEPEDLPESDLVIRYVYFFNNMKAESAKSILSSMISEQNIIENRDLNVCIIKDKSLSIKSSMKIIKELDVGGLREAIELVPLKWANADNVKQLFSDIIGEEKESRTIRFTSLKKSKESAFFSSATKIYPEPIKNALVLMGTQKNINRIKEFIKKYVDIPIDDAESRVFIKELKYVRAEDIQPILEGIIQPPRGAGGSEKAMVIEGGYKVFEDVVIAAESDEPASGKGYGSGNRLIIACNREDRKRLEQFIDKIDKPQPQAAIEVMIVDVGTSQERELGAQINKLRGKNFARNLQGDFTNLSTLSKISGADKDNPDTRYIRLAEKLNLNNPTFVTLGRPGTTDNPANENIWGFIRAVMNLDNSQIISQPYLVVNNNQESNVTINRTDLVAGRLDASKTINAVQQKEEVNAKVEVKLTPHINLSGTIDLELDITVDEFKQTELTDTPELINRHLVTKAAMAAGEVLILGGLTNSNLKKEISKTPILSSIPILGSLFKRRTKTKTEQNLYIFIRPTIIKPRFEGAPDEYTQLKLDYAKLQIQRTDDYAQDSDPIQRWFFKPTHQTIKQRVSNAARGVVPPIDKYIFGRNRPRMVNIQEDPYFKVSSALEKSRMLREQRRRDAAQKRAALKKA